MQKCKFMPSSAVQKDVDHVKQAGDRSLEIYRCLQVCRKIPGLTGHQAHSEGAVAGCEHIRVSPWAMSTMALLVQGECLGSSSEA